MPLPRPGVRGRDTCARRRDARESTRSLIRRSEHFVVRWRDVVVPDVPAMLGGVARTTTVTQAYAASLVTGRERAIRAADLELLLRLPVGSFVDERESGLDEQTLGALLEDGFVVTGDTGDPRRARDDALTASQWHPAAAAYRALSRWEGANAAYFDVDPERLDAAIAEVAGEHELEETPPSHFHERGGAATHLPVPREATPLRDVLARRRTTRSYDPDASLPLDALARLLHDAFGARAYARLHERVVALRKTSPSGGGLHPIEAYPVVLRVSGFRPGVYHYRVRDHALETVESLALDDAKSLVRRLTAGQVWFDRAQVLVLLTARFERTFWKYERHEKAYAVVLMDAGHVSQTFQLVCAELGLGACVSAAVNDADIERVLGIDGVREGAIAVVACGAPATTPTNLDPDFEPYVPRETQI